MTIKCLCQITPIGEEKYWAFTNVSVPTPMTASVWTNGMIPISAPLGSISWGSAYASNFFVLPSNNITFKCPISCGGSNYLTNNAIIEFSNVVEYATMIIPIAGDPDVATISGYIYIDGDIVGPSGGTYDLVSIGCTQTNGANSEYGVLQLYTPYDNGVDIQLEDSGANTYKLFAQQLPTNTWCWFSLQMNCATNGSGGTVSFIVDNASTPAYVNITQGTTNMQYQANMRPTVWNWGNNENGTSTNPFYFSSFNLNTTNTTWPQKPPTTYVSASANMSDVKSSIAMTSPGDTVWITNSPNYVVWTNTIYTTNISISGYLGQTNSIFNTNNVTSLYCYNETNWVLGLSNICFIGNPNKTEQFVGDFVVQDGIWHVTDCVDTNCYDYGGAFVNTIGCCDHCWFWADVVGSTVEIWGNGYGNSEWATPMPYGTTNMLVFENDVFTTIMADSNNFTGGWPALDMDKGAIAAFRYNNFTNHFVQLHGTETVASPGSPYRGARGFEIYNNVFANNVIAGNVYQALYDRSGSGVIFSNTLVGVGTVMGLYNFRSEWAYAVWNAANGLNPWDSNNITPIVTSTATTGSGSQLLKDSIQNWTTNQFFPGYEVVDITGGGTSISNATGAFGVISSNGKTNLNCNVESEKNSTYFTSTSGDSYEILQVYQALDQPGEGSGDLVIADANGNPSNTVTHSQSWPHEVIEGIYQWTNNLYSYTGSSLGLATTPTPDYNVIISNLDYYDNTPKPGYTPLTYPAPLDGGGTPTNPIVITQQPLSGTVVYNTSTNLTITVTGTSPVYQWYIGTSGTTTTPISGATTYSFTTPSLTITTNYWCQVTNILGSTNSSTATITVLPYVSNIPTGGIFPFLF